MNRAEVAEGAGRLEDLRETVPGCEAARIPARRGGRVNNGVVVGPRNRVPDVDNDLIRVEREADDRTGDCLRGLGGGGCCWFGSGGCCWFGRSGCCWFGSGGCGRLDRGRRPAGGASRDRGFCGLARR